MSKLTLNVEAIRDLTEQETAKVKGGNGVKAPPVENLSTTWPASY